MSKALVVNLDKCTGCRSCELACSFGHHGEFNPIKSAIQVSIFTDQAFYVPVVCQQCARPACAEVCPTGALYKCEKNGASIVMVDTTKCMGCRVCTLACPFGTITIKDTGCAQKCDLCGGYPECVVFCMTGALEFKNVEAASLEKTRATADRIRRQKEGQR